MSYNRTNTFETQITKSKNAFMVAPKYRTNPNSQISGGTVVKVDYRNGSSRIYDNIKNTEAYINRILSYNNPDIIAAYEM